MTRPEPFTVLIAVYRGDRPDFLQAAFRSAVHGQTRPPDQVVVVRDGPVPDELARCVDELVADSPVAVTVVTLEENRMLGPALDAGLAASRHDVVARMDADDICMPQRFEVQMPLIEAGADIVGAGLLEFCSDPSNVVARRTPPTNPVEIARYARFHSPFNHPTVVYRRSAVLAAGGYRDLPLMEDYWLFARMIANGAQVANVAEPLVYYRVGAGAYARRGGLAQLRSELGLQRRLRQERFTTRPQYLRNLVLRGGYRLLPEFLRRAMYRRVIATYGERREGTPRPGEAEPPSDLAGTVRPGPKRMRPSRPQDSP